ncbi:MAG: cyclic nucleotide-binding domain-containing protein [Rhodospirillales bacterium]|nr:cyclic nucleotide-binding domain-containing protein [Rhodospirillales bacterium]
MANLSGKTFEVQVLDGGRWTTVDVHEGRTPAVGKAEKLVESGKYAAVKVLSDSDRAGTEVVFEKVVKADDERPVTLVPLQTAPVCMDFIDYYRPAARRALGRVLRNHFDRNGCSALEFLFDRMEMTLLERNDALFPQTIQQIATAQARVLSVKPSERIDVLYAAGKRIKENALAYVNQNEGFAALRKTGVDGLLKLAATQGDAETSYLFVRHALAVLLGEGGDWNSKIELVVALGSPELSAAAVDCIDEILAELLEGSAAVGELLGGQADALRANRALILLTEGRFESPANPLSCIVAFNDLMARHDLVQTRAVLYQRVAGYLASTRNLTREGPRAEREAFGQLLRDLTEMAGLKGGPAICGSVTQRARIVLSEGEDLSVEEAITKVTGMLPNRGSRIGYLLELFQSAIGKKNGKIILTALGNAIRQVNSLASLVPEGSSDDTIAQAIDGLKRKMTSEGLPKEWRETLGQAFDGLMAKPRAAKSPAKPFALNDEEYKEMISKAPERKEIIEGEVLFEEGDEGSEAYLILSGHVEIFRKIGNREEVIAKVGRGEIIGEMSLIDNQPRMASARVLEGGQVTVIDQRNLGARLDSLGQNDKVLRRLIDVLVNRMRGDGRAYP